MALTYQQLLVAVPLVLQAKNVPNIVGDAGIGKSALVEEVAKQLDARLFTTVVSLSEKGDLAIPVPPLTSDSFVQTQHYGRLANVQFGYSETLIEIIKYAEQHPQKKIIWFLDEFNRGTQAVQSELMNLVLQRQINSLQLPSSVQIVIAENPDSTMRGFEDREYGVAVSDNAIKDRTVRLVMTTSTTEWLEWARQPQAGNDHPKINPLVIKYLQAHPDRLSVISDEEIDLRPTPRAWERVSRNLTQLLQRPLEIQKQLAADLFSGDLGTEVGVSFAEFVLSQGNVLTVEKLLADRHAAQEFDTSDEATKLHLLRKWAIDKPELLTSDQGTARFYQLLKLVGPDGQFAIAQTIGQQLESVIQPLYKQAQRDQQGNAAQLYSFLAEIATRGDEY